MIFEPTGRGSDKLFAEAIRLAHIVKYADERLGSLDDVMENAPVALVEIQTQGVAAYDIAIALAGAGLIGFNCKQWLPRD